MVEEQGGLGEARQLRRNLEETCVKIRENINIKLENYLEPLLCVPLSDKYHWWLALILDPIYVNSLTCMRELH